MSTIDAIYEGGVFRPIQPVTLPENQRVRIEVRPVTATTTAAAPLAPSAELLLSAGSIDADVPDLCERLDDYLGEGLSEGLLDKPNG